MNENKYGHLLDKYMDGCEKKDYSGILQKEEQKYKDTENNRYGNLLENAKPDYKLYGNILRVSDTCRAVRQHKAEEERQLRTKRQERIEREMDEHIEKNNAFANSYLEKKQAEQEAIRKAREEKSKEETEQQELYKSIDRLMNISPKLADAFVEARTHTWK